MEVCLLSCFHMWTRHLLSWPVLRELIFQTCAPTQVSSKFSQKQKLFFYNYRLIKYYPIVQPLRCIRSFGRPKNTLSARFDGNGSRLLCRPKADLPVIYNVPTEQQQPIDKITDKIEFTAPGYTIPSKKPSPFDCCFAGENDELVVASSVTDGNFYIWSAPSDAQANQTIDQALLSLPANQTTKSVRFSKAISTLASGDVAGVIKLWTSSTKH